MDDGVEGRSVLGLFVASLEWAKLCTWLGSDGERIRSPYVKLFNDVAALLSLFIGRSHPRDLSSRMKPKRLGMRHWCKIEDDDRNTRKTKHGPTIRR